MKSDNGQHIILANSYGEPGAYACTVANAKAILNAHLGNLPPEVLEVARLLEDPQRTATPYSAKMVVEGIAEYLQLKPGEPAPKMRLLHFGRKPREGDDTRPTVLVDEAMQQAVVLWLFKHGIAANQVDSELAQRMTELRPEKELELLAPFAARLAKDIHYVRHADYLDAADELRKLRANRWREEAPEHRVVERYLSFVTDWLVDRDHKYDVVKLEGAFA